jgi:hypothetical protein
MPLYLSRFSYTPETWAKLIGKPEGPPKGRSVVHRVGRREASWILVRLRRTRRLQPMGGPRQCVHGRGCAGHRRRRCASLVRNDSSPDRGRNDGCSAQGRASQVPSAGGVAARGSASNTHVASSPQNPGRFSFGAGASVGAAMESRKLGEAPSSTLSWACPQWTPIPRARSRARNAW